MASPNLLTLTEANFAEEVLRSEVPVLVDFGAKWCGPCKAMIPILDDLAQEYDGHLKIGQVNTEDQQALASEHGIEAIPTLLLFKNGQVADKMIGLRSKRALKTNLDRVVS